MKEQLEAVFPIEILCRVTLMNPANQLLGIAANVGC